MEDEELVRLARSSAKTIRKAKEWRLAAGNLIWVVLSLQAASIGQIPVFLCCLGLLLTPLLVTCILPCWFLRRVYEGSPSLLVVLINKNTPVEFRLIFVEFWVEKFYGIHGRHL